jgi:hypothetical protein
MKWIVLIITILKIIFVISAIIKIFSTFVLSKSTKNSKHLLNTELRISRLLYYNASLLLFLYWFNPFSGKICLKGEEKLLVLLFALIEGI